MLMGLHDILAAVQDTQEREEIRKRFLMRMDAKRREVDLSDIPEATDFSRFRPGKPYIDKMREHNLRVRAEREKQEQAILTK